MEGEGGEVMKSDPALWESPHKMQLKMGSSQRLQPLSSRSGSPEGDEVIGG